MAVFPSSALVSRAEELQPTPKTTIKVNTYLEDVVPNMNCLSIYDLIDDDR